MTARAASWLPLSAGERSVAIEVLVHGPLSRTRHRPPARPLGGQPHPADQAAHRVGPARRGRPRRGAPAEVRQGRPSQPLDVVAESRSFLGFKITEDMVYGVVTTLAATSSPATTCPLTTHDPAEVADVLAEMTEELGRGLPRSPASASVSAACVQDRAVVGESPFLQWRDVPLADLVEERTGLPVVVENDVAALVEAETWFGAGRGLDRFVVLTIGAGIGYGLVLRRQAGAVRRGGPRLRPALDREPNGPLTPDGERGSAVSLLTIPSIRYQVRAATGRDHSYEEILALAAAGDPMAARVIDEAARALGTLVAQIANFAMPREDPPRRRGRRPDRRGGQGRRRRPSAPTGTRWPPRSTWRPRCPTSTTGRAERAVLAIQVLVLGVGRGGS